MSIFLNGFKVQLSAPTFDAYVQELPNNQEFKSFREELGDEWFLHWREGVLYAIPKVAVPQKTFGQAIELNCNDHLQLLKSRIANLLPEIFSKYEPFRRKPFTFLAQRKELVSEILENVENSPEIVGSFKIFPKYILEPKIFELRNDEVGIGLFLRLKTSWQIQASLSSLQSEKVNLQGLYVVRRDHIPGQRRLVGRVKSFSEGIVYLSESFDNLESIAEEEVYLEGSKASFSRCLKAILGSQYESFESVRTYQESLLLTGPALHTTLKEMKKFLVKKSPLQIAPNLQGKVSDQIEVINNKEYKSFIHASPVEYCFDAARTKKALYAWPGIDKYQPFDRNFFHKKTPEILVFFPDTVQGAVENFLRQLRDGVSITKRVVDEYGNKKWVENSRFAGGFAKIFGLVNPKFTLQAIPWINNTHKSPASVYREEIEEVLSNRENIPDAAIVVILDNQARLPDSENPYLHSKAILLTAGVPVQEVRLSTINKTKESLQYILQNFSLGLYAKIKGLPWTVDHDLTVNDELVIGIGTCELSGSRFTERQKFVSITTVFRGEGSYLLGNLSKECSYDEYPNELKKSTLSILKDIKKRNAWKPDDTIRLVFHAAKPLKNIEIAKIVADCVNEVGNEQNVEFAFLTVSHTHPFTVLDKSQLGIKSKGIYAPQRGMILQLGRYTRLLSTNSPQLIKRRSSPLPTPLLIHLHPESNYYDLTYLSEQVLKFTSLSWKSTLPASDPVTIYYSELIAGLLTRLKNISGWSPTMLNIKLRASKWFL